VNRTQLHVDQRIFKVGYTAAVEKITEPVHGYCAVECIGRQSRKTWHWYACRSRVRPWSSHRWRGGGIQGGERIAKGENDTRPPLRRAIAQSLLAELA